MARKKHGSVVTYKTDRERLDRIEQAAEENGLSFPRMLDRIVDEWCGVKPENKKDTRPWYLK